MGKGNQDLGHFLGVSNQTINVMGVNNLWGDIRMETYAII